MVMPKEELSSLSRQKKVFFWGILFILLFIFVLLLYLGSVVLRTTRVYQYVKSNQRGWSGKVHTSHPELGFSPIPGTQGAHVFPIGPKIPMRYDQKGFRIPVDEVVTSSPPHPLVLALGDSFTYGDACLAEETYPYLIGC